MTRLLFSDYSGTSASSFALAGPSWSFEVESVSSLNARLAQHLKCARAQGVALLGGLSAYSGFASDLFSALPSSFVDDLPSSHSRSSFNWATFTRFLVTVVASSSPQEAVGAALCFERVPHPVRGSTRQAAGSFRLRNQLKWLSFVPLPSTDSTCGDSAAMGLSHLSGSSPVVPLSPLCGLRTQVVVKYVGGLASSSPVPPSLSASKLSRSPFRRSRGSLRSVPREWVLGASKSSSWASRAPTDCEQGSTGLGNSRRYYTMPDMWGGTPFYTR